MIYVNENGITVGVLDIGALWLFPAGMAVSRMRHGLTSRETVEWLNEHNLFTYMLPYLKFAYI